MKNSTIKIIVKTNSPKNKLSKISDDVYKVNIKAKPENNEANIEIEKFLAKQFGRPVKIISGYTSKKKLVRI